MPANCWSNKGSTLFSRWESVKWNDANLFIIVMIIKPLNWADDGSFRMNKI